MANPVTTRWRGDPILPDGYEDVARLVALGRKARGRIVEFDWSFSLEDLRRLRHAVFEWGGNAAGRYRGFDARVLAAINSALGEDDTVFVVNEPPKQYDLDGKVSCIAYGGSYRLYGHAPFDVVFGYGQSAVTDKPETRTRLGDVAGATIAAAVGQLGWDLHRLAEERLRPVRNVIYGLPVGYDIGTESAAVKPASESGPPIDVPVHFQGPFAAVEDADCPCLFKVPIAAQSGVYLWTIAVAAGDRPWYVGQTRRGFGRRMGEHVANYLSGQYSTSDAKALAEGRNDITWRADEGNARWPQTLPSFLRDFETRAANLIGLIRLLRFHVAPLEGDAHLHDRIEGVIGRHFKAHFDPDLRDFFAPGIRLPSKVPFDTALRLVLSSEAPIAGLPENLLA